MNSSEKIVDENAAAAEENMIEALAEENFSEQITEKLAEIAEHSDESEDLAASSEVMLTTIDNPFDPFEKFDDWFRYDEEKGFHTCSYLGRIADFSDEMSDEEFQKENERAIDEIIKYDFMNIYKKVRKPVAPVDGSDLGEPVVLE